MKKLFCLFLALAMLASLLPAALAEEIVLVDPEAEDEIDLVELAEPEADPIPLDDAAEPPEEERVPAESIFAEGRGAEKTWIVDVSNDGKGDCGDGVHWKLEGSTLTISGEGRMKDFTKYAPGWYSSRDSIKTVIIRSGPENVGVNAFIDCKNLTSVSFSSSVKEIGNWAFEGCTSLKSITLPKYLEAIGSGAFAYDTALTKIEIASGNETFQTSDGVLYSADGQILVCWPGGRGGAVTLPDGLLAVFDEAFEGCDMITSLQCGKELIYFGLAACYGCTALQSVSFGDELLEIGAGAFYGCIRLPSLRIPQKVQIVDAYAFDGCLSLQSLDFPDSVQELGAYVCTDCTSLESVTIGRSVKTINKHAFENCTSLKAVVIPDSVTLIDDWAFAGCGELKSAVIGNGVKTIGERAFNACVKMTDLTLGSSIKAIGEYAFYGCKRVQAIDLPDTLTTLRRDAFTSCVRVKKLCLPASLVTIDGPALPNSEYLKTAGPLGSGCDVEFGWTEAIPDNAFYNLGSLESVILPEELTSIGRLAFYNLRKLEHVTLPASMTSIGKDCFFECEKLKTAGPLGSGCNIEFGWTEEIPDNAFSNSYLNSIIFPEGVKRLGKSAFEHTRLGKIVIPDSVKTIGANCFYDLLPNTYEIVIGKNVRVIGTKAFYTTYLFNGSVSFRGSVPETGEACFAYGTVLGFYPADDETWTEEARRRFGNYWIWEACLDLEGPSPAAVEMSTAGLLLAWEPMDGAEEYELQYNRNDKWETMTVTAETSFLQTNAVMNWSYDRYRVRARIGDTWTYYGLSVKIPFQPFTDIPSSGKTFEYVSWAFNSGIITGTTPTTFSPNDPCTRVQFVMMLWKMKGSPIVEGENPFKDIKGAKTTKAILWALDRGIINSGTRFHPEDNISRIQIVMILWKMYGSVKETIDIPFTDVTGSKTIMAVRWAYKYGITTGTSDTTFSPDDDCTRLQLVIFLNRCSKYRGPY